MVAAAGVSFEPPQERSPAVRSARSRAESLCKRETSSRLCISSHRVVIDTEAVKSAYFALFAVLAASQPRALDREPVPGSSPPVTATATGGTALEDIGCDCDEETMGVGAPAW